MNSGGDQLRWTGLTGRSNIAIFNSTKGVIKYIGGSEMVVWMYPVSEPWEPYPAVFSPPDQTANAATPTAAPQAAVAK